MSKSSRIRLRGMLLGLAIGDALGAPIEHGHTSDEIVACKEELRHMHDEAHFPRGVWTDDTSMALCLADSLLECGGYDSWNVMDKYCKWQSAGAYYGLDAIPNEWRRDVYQGNDIIELADKLAAMDDCPVLYTRFEEDVT